jgi:hypothetical protein
MSLEENILHPFVGMPSLAVVEQHHHKHSINHIPLKMNPSNLIQYLLLIPEVT